MGSQLVRTAYLMHGSRLDHAPMRLLAWMALAPRDDDPEPKYWAGRDALAHGLGYLDLPADPTTADERRRVTAARRSVDRALAALTDAGAVSTTQRARSRTRQCYRLHLWTTATQDHGERGAEDHGERGAEDHGERGAEDHGERGAEDHGERGPYTQRTPIYPTTQHPTRRLPGDVTKAPSARRSTTDQRVAAGLALAARLAAAETPAIGASA